ncbi:MAG: hypothetical protein AAFY72_07800 [Cyanobacteria bacterium J06649_4]
MVNRYTLGGAILSIFLLAIFGIRGAFSWLSNSPQTTNRDRVVAIDGNNTGNSAGNFNDRIRVADDQNNVQVDGQNSQPSTSSPSTVAQNLTPLQEAGTYIQRQKRVERDPIVAQTQVDVVPISTDNTTTAQNNTRVTPQPTATSSNTQSSQRTPAAPASQAVPALW